eukprot:COSAG02_NODE_67_length_42609_cov_14.506681_21_plen_107_part_00
MPNAAFHPDYLACSYMTKETAAFGAALRATMDAPVATVSNIVTSCDEPIILNLSKPVTFDMIQTRENMLTGGQRIAKYSVEAWVDGAWCVHLLSFDCDLAWANSIC